MGGDRSARRPIEGEIDSLEAEFGPIPINQTTMTVPAAAYEAAGERGRENGLDAFVRIRNDDGAVFRPDGERGGPVPWYTFSPAGPVGYRVADAVAGEFGVECVVDDAVRATIAGVRDASDPDAPTRYRLGVLLEATHERGAPAAGVWDDDPSVPGYV